MVIPQTQTLTSRSDRGIGAAAPGRRGRVHPLAPKVALWGILLLNGAVLAEAPRHVRTELLRPKDAPYTLNDSIRIQSVWEGQGIVEVKAHFRAILTGTADTLRVLTQEPDSSFLLRARLPAIKNYFQPDGLGLPIPITARNADGAVTDTTLRIDLDSTPVGADRLLLDFVPSVTTLSYTNVSGSARGADTVDVRREFALVAKLSPDSATGHFETRVDLPRNGPFRIYLSARDRAGNVTNWPQYPVVVTRINGPGQEPILLHWTREDTLEGGGIPPLHNRLDEYTPASTLRLRTEWTVPDTVELADQLTVLADFSALDQGLGRTDVIRDDTRHGVYRILHYLPDAIPVGQSDGKDIAIPITAEGPTGRTNDTSVRVCLSNHPPLHVRSRLLSQDREPLDRHTYVPGESLWIETVWTSTNRPLTIRADFRNLVPLFNDSTSSAKVSERGDSTYIISYRLPFNVKGDELAPDGDSLPIPITARDKGCGLSRATCFGAGLDKTPPSLPVLDPLPSETTVDSIRITGSAPGAYRIVVARNLVDQEPLLVPDEQGRFAGVVRLTRGENTIQVRSEDEAGNSSKLTNPRDPNPTVVIYVDASRFFVTSPYTRTDRNPGDDNDAFVFEDGDGLDSANLRILNLEGDCLWEIELSPTSGSTLKLRYHWGGTDQRGQRAPQGYYLAHAEWRTRAGRNRARTTGFLLKD